MFNKVFSGCNRRRAGTGLLLAALLASCAARAPLLNSERIAERFGSYAIEVLAADDRVRVSSLASRHGGRTVTRTLAIVAFADPRDERVAAEHARIVAGESIGAVFRESGWAISKPLLHVGELRTSQPAVARLMAVTVPVTLALHAYRFEVRRDGTTLPYATIVELHHPGYLGRDDVTRLYGAENAVLSSAETAALERRVAAVVDRLGSRLAP